MADSHRRTFSMSSRLPRLSRAPSMAAVRGIVDHGTNMLPFASYPVMLPVRSRKIVPTFFVAAIIIYCALTVWNVLTQGFNIVLIPTMQTTFESGGKTSCQPVQMNVGQTFYSQDSGVFNWALTGVAQNDSTSALESAFAYKGGQMQCNVTSIGVTYYFSQLTYVYGVCANCTVPSTAAVSWDASATDTNDIGNANSSTSYVSMCSNWDQSISQPASWAYAGQHLVQNKIYSFGPFLQNFTFPNGTFPTWQFPPYGAGTSPAPNNTAVTPRDALDVSVWAAGIRFMPDLLTEGGYNGNATLNGEDHKIEVFSTGEVTDLYNAYNYTTVVDYLSGTTLAFSGLGGLAVNNPKPPTWTPPEPQTITNMRLQGLSVMNYLGDLALSDIHQHEIVSDYLCTHQKRVWKGFASMLAMVLGNNAALFSLFLFAAPKLARMWDQKEHGETVLPFVETHMATAHSRRGSSHTARDNTVTSSPRESLDLTPNEKPRGENGLPILPAYPSYRSTLDTFPASPPEPQRRGTAHTSDEGHLTMSPAQMPTRRGTVDDTLDITAANTPASHLSSGSGGGRGLPVPHRQDSAPVQSPASAAPFMDARSPQSAASAGRGFWGPRPAPS